MIFLRSLAFNLAFYAVTIVEMIVFTPFYFLASRKKAWWVPKFWARSNLWLQKVLAGTGSEITGQENLPEGAYILAPKHQSFWDTFALVPHIPDAVYILKRELMWIPVFGWYLGKMNMIPIDRGSPARALRNVVVEARKRAEQGRQIVIYPEGTRRPPGAEPAYKHGIAEIYSRLGIPVVPVAHMAGLYWPRRRFLRYPGVIKVRFLPPIPPGLSRTEFMARLVDETEKACDALLIEAAQSENPPPLPPTAVERLNQLGVPVPGNAVAA
ncbi:MAG: lysophospholipid acyltransferase family protein [Rhizobiaceae bacterium]